MLDNAIQGNIYKRWVQHNPGSSAVNSADELKQLVLSNRDFQAIENLSFELESLAVIAKELGTWIKEGKKIALYADYDVDGTMSLVSWVWFLEAAGYKNYIPYIPCRFSEGYGLNMQAVRKLVEEDGAEVIITMDTGITANEEAAYCKEKGVAFICTDHHKIQPEKMPDCLILNPKLHPDPQYQEMCGCGITFVLLRRLGQYLDVDASVWGDLLALAGIATICDMVPFNGVNHKLVKLGMRALTSSKRQVLRELCRKTQQKGAEPMDELEVGFKIGPRINAVGRMDHAEKVVEAFCAGDATELLEFMESCNSRRRTLQDQVIQEALEDIGEAPAQPLLFVGKEGWHSGVIGIAASRVVESHWKPAFLYTRVDGKGKGSARSIPGFSVADALCYADDLFLKQGGHDAAAGFSFDLKNEEAINARLQEYASLQQKKNADIWQSKVFYECKLDTRLINIDVAESLDTLKPFGMGFERPQFLIEVDVDKIHYYNDKTTFKPKHTAITFLAGQNWQKCVMFNQVIPQEFEGCCLRFIVTMALSQFRGTRRVELIAKDYAVVH